MAEITAQMVKDLRERTGQGMMDCKHALVEAGGDVEAAIDLLRQRGLAKAEKKGGRETKEGLVGIASADGGAAMVQVVCETDFCARNDAFRSLVARLAGLAAAAPDGDVPASDAIKAAVQECFNKVGENMAYVRGVKISAPTVGEYLHHNGKVGVVVGVDGEIAPDDLAGLCMHIAFADPMAITPEQIDPEVVERERRIAVEQAKESGKPAPIVEKMVAGKVSKFLAANALLEQPYIRDEKKKVKQVLGGAKVTVFARFGIGQ